MTESTCSKCRNIFDTSSFYLSKKRVKGITCACKQCLKESSRLWRKENPEKSKETDKRNKAKGREKRKIKQRNYMRVYVNNRKKTDLIFKLSTSLRERFKQALKSNYKKGSAVSDLGCSIQHLKLHLELFWDDGMTWDNYGKKEGQWSIDHIMPFSKTNLNDREQLLQILNYKNLQPLWNIDNLKKGGNIL